MDMQRYLLVLDKDLLTADEELGLEPINYLVARQEQEPCEIVVLSLAGTGQPAVDPLLSYLHGNCLGALALDQDARAAEHRKNLAVRHLRTIGCKASGFISAEDLVRAVRSETGDHNYDQVILATGRQAGTWLARLLRRDPIHRLRRRWGTPDRMSDERRAYLAQRWTHWQEYELTTKAAIDGPHARQQESNRARRDPGVLRR
jgi:hypothetical protein